jgi:methyl-accepting chemotaxis protein
LIAVEPILTSDGEGPVRGYLVFGRRIDDSFIQALRARTRMNFEMWSYQDPSLPEDFNALQSTLDAGRAVRIAASSDLIRGYGSLLDWAKRPAVYFRIDEPRPIYHQSQETTRQGVLFFVMGSLTIGAVMLSLLQFTVIRRVIHLSNDMKAIEQSRDVSRRVAVTGNDEIRDLASSANFMLSAIADAQAEIEEGRTLLHKQASKFAEQLESTSEKRMLAERRERELSAYLQSLVVQLEAAAGDLGAIENSSPAAREVVTALRRVSAESKAAVASAPQPPQR